MGGDRGLMERVLKSILFGFLGLLLAGGSGFLFACAVWGVRAVTPQIALAGAFGVGGLLGGALLGAQEKVRLAPGEGSQNATALWSVAVAGALVAAVLISMSVASRLGSGGESAHTIGLLAPFVLGTWGYAIHSLRGRAARHAHPAQVWQRAALNALGGAVLGALVFGLHTLIDGGSLSGRAIGGALIGAALGGMAHPGSDERRERRGRRSKP